MGQQNRRTERSLTISRRKLATLKSNVRRSKLSLSDGRPNLTQKQQNLHKLERRLRMKKRQPPLKSKPQRKQRLKEQSEVLQSGDSAKLLLKLCEFKRLKNNVKQN